MTNNNLRKQMASLSINGKLYPLYDGVNPIGRDKNATVILKDATVSQLHALITAISGDKYYVTDFRSSNGTMIRDNKLKSLLLYELADNDIIYFANCEAIFKKISLAPTINTEDSLNVSDSFYLAQTQAMEACFEDDYDFSEVAVPVEHTSISSEFASTVPVHNLSPRPSCSKQDTSKINLSIYEQPTQLFTLEETENKGEVPTRDLLVHKISINDLPTQDMCINDMPTQIMDFENVPNQNESVVETNKSIATHSLSRGIHSLSTVNESVVEPDTSTVPDCSFDVVEETVLDDSGLDVTVQSFPASNGLNTPERSQSPLHVSQLQRRTAKPVVDDDDDSDNSSDIIPGKKKVKPLPDLSEKESQFSNKQDSQGSDVFPKKKKVKALPELTQDKKIDSGSDTEIEDFEVIKPTTSKAEVVKASKEDSGSDTEIDEAEMEVITKSEIKQVEVAMAEEKKDLKEGSNVDLESRNKIEVQPGTSTMKEDSDTDFDEAEIESSNKINNEDRKPGGSKELLIKPPTEDSGSDTDMDETELELRMKVAVVETISPKIKFKKLDFDDSDIIPSTQENGSDNDSDDFNFIPEVNSTIREAGKQIFDVSQNLKEMDSSFVTPHNSEEIRLGLSEAMDSTENAEQVESDKVQQLIQHISSDIQKEEKDSVFDQDASNIQEDEQPIEKNASHVQDEDEDDFFDQPTQKIPEKDVDSDGFVKPNIIPSRKSGNQTKADDDDIFMQATQPFSVDREDDVFDGPTQKYEVQPIHPLDSSTSSVDDDIFLQPTQALTAENSSLKAKECNDDIFMQPTQVLSSFGTESAEVVVQNKPPEDIFDQPTQVIDNDKVIQNKPPDDIFDQPTQVIDNDEVIQTKPPEDIFDQPTQVIDNDEVIQNKPPEDIFDQPTQVIDNHEVIQNKPSEDIFEQPTQVVNNAEVVQSKSPEDTLDQPAEVVETKQKPKLEEVESQLEVMFSSQNVDVTSEVNSRPSNPLIHMLEEEEEPLSSAELEYCQQSTLPIDEVIAPQEVTSEMKEDTDMPNKRIKDVSENSEELEKTTRSRRGVRCVQERSASSNKEQDNEDKVAEEKTTRSRKINNNAEKPSCSKNADLKMNNDEDDKTVKPSNATRSSSKNADLERNNDKVNKIDQPQTRSRRGTQKSESTNEEDDKKEVEKIAEVEKTIRTRRVTKTVEEPSSSKNKLEMNCTRDGKIDESEKVTRSRRGARKGQEPTSSRNEDDYKEMNTDKEVDKTAEKTTRSKKGTKSIQEAPHANNEGKKYDKLEVQEVKVAKSTKRSLRNTSPASVGEASTSKSKKLDQIVETKSTNITRRNTRNMSNKPIQEETISINVDEDNQPEISHIQKDTTADKVGKRNTRKRSTKVDLETEEASTSSNEKALVVQMEKITKNEVHKDETRDTTGDKVGKRNTRKHSTKVGLENDIKAEATTSSNTKVLVVEMDKITDKEIIKGKTKNDSEELVIESAVRSKRIASRKAKAELEETLSKEITSTRTAKVINKGNMKKVEEIESETSEPAFKASTRKTRSEKSTNEESVPATPSKTRKKKASEDVEETPKAAKSRRMKLSESEEASTSKVILSSPSGSKTRKAEEVSVQNKRSRSKRLLSTDSEESGKLSLKKSKQDDESSSSEQEFRVSSRRGSLLNTTLGTPERNRRTQKPKVVFTMINSPELDGLESVVRSLGGTVVDTVEACTVLVTSALKRSQKLLSAVGQSKAICSVSWLKECKKVHKFLDPWDFILHDKEAEAKWNLSLRESLNRSQNKKLLEGYTVLLAVSEAVDVLKAAVDSCGGKYVTKAPTKNTETNLIVIGNPNKKASYSKYLKQKVTVVAPEAIFDGVLRQEVRWKDHILT